VIFITWGLQQVKHCRLSRHQLRKRHGIGLADAPCWWPKSLNARNVRMAYSRATQAPAASPVGPLLHDYSRAD
jgi:hypothetical protein